VSKALEAEKSRFWKYRDKTQNLH